MRIKIPKPRNMFAVLALRRRAGTHTKSNKQKRLVEKRDLKTGKLVFILRQTVTKVLD